MGEWQPIETAPRDGTFLLVGRFDPKGDKDRPNNLYRIDRWHSSDRHTYEGWGLFNDRYWPATHWQPLPEPPSSANMTP